MTNELTLEILDEAIAKIKEYEYNNEIIGFKLNPSDYCNIKAKTDAIWCVTNNKLIVQPPYYGLKLVSDKDVPPGHTEPIRRVK